MNNTRTNNLPFIASIMSLYPTYYMTLKSMITLKVFGDGNLTNRDSRNYANMASQIRTSPTHLPYLSLLKNIAMQLVMWAQIAQCLNCVFSSYQF